MEVSVIIPVYNAEPFVERAVRSALMQPEVKEVLVVDDGSTDGSLAILQRLQPEDSRIRLFRHPGGANLGPGASRNLGLQHARCAFVAFLDADDCYVENRFENTKEAFKKIPEADGVFGTAQAVAVASGQAAHRAGGYIRMQSTSWDSLFDDLLIGEKGYFSITTLVMKKQFIDIIGAFDPELLQSEDTDFMLRCAVKGKLFQEDPSRVLVSVYDHGSNITHNRVMVSRYRWKLFQKWLPFMVAHPRSKETNSCFFRALLDCHPLVRKFDGKGPLRKLAKAAVFLACLAKSPKIARLFL